MKPMPGLTAGLTAGVAFPPFTNGGPIEAGVHTICTLAPRLFPPFTNGGPIEAVSDGRLSGVHRCRFPPFTNGGPIEANRQAQNRSGFGEFPPFTNGGPIEASPA